jgi:carbon-monoxide dehydrogenase medium subunit
MASSFSSSDNRMERHDSGQASIAWAKVGADAQVRRAVPLLAQVTPFVGQIRNRGTLGGSIAHADAAGEYPGSRPHVGCGDRGALAAWTRREIGAADFFTGMWETTMESDEVLTGVRFPLWNSRSGFAVHEFPCRHGDFAIAGALVAVQLDDRDRVPRCAIGLLGLGRATGAEESIIGKPVNELAAEEIGRAGMTGLDDIPTDLQGSASYRTQARRHGRAPGPTPPGSSRGVKRCMNNRSSCRSTELPSQAVSNRA